MRVRGGLCPAWNPLQRGCTHDQWVIPQLDVQKFTGWTGHAERGIHKTYGDVNAVGELRVGGHGVDEKQIRPAEGALRV